MIEEDIKTNNLCNRFHKYQVGIDKCRKFHLQYTMHHFDRDLDHMDWELLSD